jgi:hypothetical protein
MKTATKIKNLANDPSRKVDLYKLSEPLNGYEYVRSSAVIHNPNNEVLNTFSTLLKSFTLSEGMQERVARIGQEKETFLFGSYSNGMVADWGELPGSTPDIFDTDQAIRNAGYHVVDPNRLAN